MKLRPFPLVMALALLAPSPVLGQDEPGWLFPDVRYFGDLIADPYAARLAIGLIRTDLFERRGPERPAYTTSPGTGVEIQAAAAIGMTFPVFHVARLENGGGVTIGAEAGVFGRFRIEKLSRDDLGQDWFVGMPVEAAWGESSLRFRLIHRSSHLGDEFSQTTGGERIEFGGEAFDLLMARRLGGLRAYGGAGWIFHSNTSQTAILRSLRRSDRYTAQAGVDGEWRPFEDPRISVRAGVDWQSTERTGWKATWAMAGGLRAAVGRGTADLMMRYMTGRSTLGQFFLTRESVWSLEVVLGRS